MEEREVENGLLWILSTSLAFSDIIKLYNGEEYCTASKAMARKERR